MGGCLVAALCVGVVGGAAAQLVFRTWLVGVIGFGTFGWHRVALVVGVSSCVSPFLEKRTFLLGSEGPVDEKVASPIGWGVLG